MMTATTATTVKRSWADIVKGCATSMPLDADLSATASELEAFTIDEAEEVLTPSKRGERHCPCQGEILVMLGHYAWIMTFDAIDHPDVWKTAGRVYVHKRDLPKGLSQGDIVSFYLYTDDQGLGAECCRLEQRASPGFCADADEFVPMGYGQQDKAAWPNSSWNVGAAEFSPVIPVFDAQASEFVPGFSAQAAEFVPGFNAKAGEFVPAKLKIGKHSQGSHRPTKASTQAVWNFNPALLDDILSDDESDDETSTVCGDNSSGIDGTTSGGLSESESEDTTRYPVGPPPGLSCPAAFRPPPGLTLPGEEE